MQTLCTIRLAQASVVGQDDANVAVTAAGNLFSLECIIPYIFPANLSSSYIVCYL